MVDGEVDDDVPPNTPPSVSQNTPPRVSVNTPGTHENAIIGSPSSQRARVRRGGVSQGDGYLSRLGIDKNGNIKKPSHAGRLNFNNP